MRTKTKAQPDLRPWLALAGLIVLSAAVLTLSANYARAAIQCQGPYQIIRGYGKQATPYCQDNYLAGIARGYGWKVSNSAVRHNPNLKARICRQIGHDSRLIGICAGYRSDGKRGPWPL